MVGSLSDVNQGTTAGGIRAGRGQSPRSSEEAGNDRGAKGGRDVVWDGVVTFFQKSQHSAARLSVLAYRKTGLDVPRRTHSEPPAKRVSGAQACAAGTTLPKAQSRVPEPVHPIGPRTGKPDAGKPPVRFGWGATEQSVLYPHAKHILSSATQRALFHLIKNRLKSLTQFLHVLIFKETTHENNRLNTR